MKFLAAVILVFLAAAAPALACLPPPVGDGMIDEHAGSGAVAIGRVTAVRPVTRAQCLRRTRGQVYPGAPGPASDNCNGPLGTADVRIERAVAGQAAGVRRVAWGQTLQCRAGFTPRRGDRVALFVTDAPGDSPLFGRLTGWALPEDQARQSPRLAAAFDARP